MPEAEGNYVEITFDGQAEKFELTLGEIEELEEAFDKPVSEINFERIKAIRMITGFALRRRQRNRHHADIDAEMAAMSMTEFERRSKPADPPTKPKGKATAAGDA
jgi:hypothetical protein